MHPAGLQDMLLYRLNRLRAVGGGMVLRYCEGRFGVTRREWVMLALLSGGDTLQPSELARRAELTASATSKAVVALVKKKLIARKTQAGDRRVALLTLTPAGHALYAQIRPVVEDINRELMAELTWDEVAMLDSMLERMQAQAERMLKTRSQMPRADRRGGGSRRIEFPPG
jgi:DNA-binding MarR family transcriptional regulator